jgi:DNA-binding NarL/FixJ family response regulator
MSFWKDLFKSKEQEKTGLVFIVEDNKPYAETLKVFLDAEVPVIKEIKVFPVGETCLLELKKNPDIIIIDYFLDSKYYDAGTGLEIIKQIREEKPEVNIIVLSSQEDIEVVLEIVKKYNCSYVKKDTEAFEKVGEIVADIYKA